MTSNQPSTRSTHNSSAKPSRNAWVIGGVVAIIFLFLIFGFSSTKQAAITSLVKDTTQKPPAQREQALKTLSVATWHNDTVQKALADYYISINRYDRAGETLEKGSSYLSVEAAKNFSEAGEYTRAQAELMSIPTQKLTPEGRAELARVAFNLNDVTKGCDLAQQSANAELQDACNVIKGKVSREASYKLIGLRIYTPAVQVLERVSPKTSGDWLILARILTRQNKNNEAADHLSRAVEALPFDRTVAKAAIGFCKQQGSEVQACKQLSQRAQKALTATDFKS